MSKSKLYFFVHEDPTIVICEGMAAKKCRVYLRYGEYLETHAEIPSK